MPEFTGRLRTPRLAAAPASPVTGEMYYDTITNKLYWWNGAIWVDAVGGASQAYVDTRVPPVGGSTGQVLAKIDNTDYNTEWVTAAAGGTSPTAPMFSAYRSPTVANGLPNLYSGALAFNVEEYDTNGWYDASTGRFTPLEAGRYLIQAAVTTATAAVNGMWQVIVFKNGADYKTLYAENQVAIGQALHMGGSVIVDANGTTDYFDIRVYQTSGSAKDFVGDLTGIQSFFQAVKADRVGPKGDTGSTTGAPLVTALPTVGLVDGQEVNLQNTAMAALNILWHMRWSSTAAKWLFLGGAKYRIRSTGPYTASVANTWEAIPTGTMVRFTAPQAGQYRFLWGARHQAQVATVTESYLGIALSTSPGSPIEYARQNTSSATGVAYNQQMMEVDSVLASGATITIVVNTQSAAGNIIYAVPWIHVEPVYLT